MKYVYTVDNLEGAGIGLKHFSSLSKATAYAKSHGYTSGDYCSEWIVELSIPSHAETKYPTHVTIRKEVVL